MWHDPVETTPLTDEDKDMLNQLEDRSAELNDWETQFIDNISRKDELTDTQRNKLTEIYNKLIEGSE